MKSSLIKCYSNFLENRFLKNLRHISAYTKVIYREDMGRAVELLEDIKAGTLLGIYPGKQVSLKNFLEKEEFVTRSVKSAYLLGNDRIIDPTDIFGYVPDQPEYRIAFVNEPSEKDSTNVIAVSSNKHVWYVTIDDVYTGQQLFTSYGDTYERNYDYKNLELKDSQIKILRHVSEKYIWLKEGLRKVLEEYK